MSERYSDIVDYTQAELKYNLKDYINISSEKLSLYHKELLKKI